MAECRCKPQYITKRLAELQNILKQGLTSILDQNAPWIYRYTEQNYNFSSQQPTKPSGLVDKLV